MVYSPAAAPVPANRIAPAVRPAATMAEAVDVSDETAGDDPPPAVDVSAVPPPAVDVSAVLKSPRSAALAASKPTAGKLGSNFLTRVSHAEQRDSARGAGSPRSNREATPPKRPPRRSLADLP